MRVRIALGCACGLLVACGSAVDPGEMWVKGLRAGLNAAACSRSEPTERYPLPDVCIEALIEECTAAGLMGCEHIQRALDELGAQR